LIVIDSNFEEIAVFEARKLGIPIVGIVDTNADPEGITYPVPGNDDAIRSIKLFTTKFGEAVKVGLERRLSDSLNQEAKAVEEETAATEEENVIDAVDEAEIDRAAKVEPIDEDDFYEEEDEPETDDGDYDGDYDEDESDDDEEDDDE